MAETKFRVERSTGIGGSEVAVLLGLSPWGSRRQLYETKVNGYDPFHRDEGKELPDYIIMGQIFEEPIAREWAKRNGIGALFTAEELDLPVRHPDCFELIGHPDFLYYDQEDELCILEVKTTGAHRAEAWETEAPLYYQAQVQTYMATTGLAKATIVCVIGGQKMVSYELTRDDDLIESILKNVREFWDQHIQPKNPPKPVAVDDLVVKDLYAEEIAGRSFTLPTKAKIMDDLLQAAKAEKKEVDAKVKELQVRFQDMIGYAEEGLIPGSDFKYTWKTQHRKAYEVKENSFRVLRRVKVR